MTSAASTTTATATTTSSTDAAAHVDVDNLNHDKNISKGCSSPGSPNGSSSQHSRVSLTQETSSEPDSDDCYADVGFMFEGCQPSTLKRFQWVREGIRGGDDDDDGEDQPKPKQQQPEVRVALHVVDDEPGALQSGHYLWPAAPALAEFLIPLSHNSRWNPHNIMELGAGCGLLSLTALQLMHDSLHCVVVTDHDPGTLERARDNYETTLEDLLESTESEEEQFDCINSISSIPILFESLSWGDVTAAQRVASAAAEHSAPLVCHIQSEEGSDSASGAAATTTTTTSQDLKQQQALLNPNFSSERNIFDLILGSDLIYCQEVVEPLFKSVSYFLTPGGFFLLSQSFPYDEESEQTIDDICANLKLQRTVLSDTMGEGKEDGMKIQQFAWPLHQQEEPKTEDEAEEIQAERGSD